jgi:hypothetical protein
MKKAKFIMIAVALAGAALFTGCKKDAILNSLNPSASHMAEVIGTDTTTVSKGIVHYHFQTLPQKADNPMQWNYARMNAIELLFGGTYIAVPTSIPMSAQTTIHKVIPLAVLTDLGVVRPRAGGYSNILFQVRVYGTDTGLSIVMTGTYNTGTGLVPMRLVVDQNILLQGKWPAETKILLPGQKEHVALLEMDLDKLTMNIDPALFLAAINDPNAGKEVLISSQSNGALFQAIFKNLIDPEALIVHFE